MKSTKPIPKIVTRQHPTLPNMVVFQLQTETAKREQQKPTLATNQGSKALPRV